MERKDVAKAYGYRRKKNNLADVLPGYMIGGDEFLNDKDKLPCAPGRTWYEADIDYTYGKRNLKRIFAVIQDYLSWHKKTLEESLNPPPAPKPYTPPAKPEENEEES